MAARRVEVGPTGHTVRRNIAFYRKQRRITLRELSTKMTELGRPMSNSSLSQIENGSRRVDVDDLMAIAVALNVSPKTLLVPHTSSADETVEVTGIRAIAARELWPFLEARPPNLAWIDEVDPIDITRMASYLIELLESKKAADGDD